MVFLLLTLNRFYVYITLNRFRICSWAIYKTRNTGTGNGMRGMRAKRGMFTRIPGNVIILTFWGMFQKIPENVEEDSGECSRGFRRMFQIIPGNFQEDSEECLKRFWGMFEEIQGNAHEGSGECLKADSRVE